MTGIGTDIIEIRRIRELKRPQAFIEKLLGPKERQIFEGLKHPSRRVEFLAGRWAAKEALYKALGPAVCKDLAFGDFEVLNDESGRPYLEGELGSLVMISISHCQEYAVAFVVAH